MVWMEDCYSIGWLMIEEIMALCYRNYNEEANNKHLNFCKRRYENVENKNKTKNSNSTGMKNQHGSSFSGGVKYNNGKYNKNK